MKFIHKRQSFRKTLFWRLFANYFVLILIPAIVASTIAHFHIVQVIEQDAKKLNDVVMSHFTEQTDTALTNLKTNMIHMLSASNLRSLLKQADNTSPEDQQRSELIHALREQLFKLQSDELVAKAYLYFVHHDLVIDVDTYTDKEYYFQFRYPLEGSEKTALLAQLQDKKMMEFTDPHSSHFSALMSYPFNTNTPEVYLVVNLDEVRLKEKIRITENWVTGTAIMGSKARVVGETGINEEEMRLLQEKIRKGTSGSHFLIANDKAISLVQSRFDDTWHYVSMVDMQTLMKPAHSTRIFSWLFLLFFLVVGSFVSYYLSRRLYKPIMEIKERLKQHSVSSSQIGSDGNDFDVIKRSSQWLITENKELTQLVDGMFPIVQEHFVTRILLGEYRDELSIEYYAKEIEFAYNKRATRTVLCIALHYDLNTYGQLSEASKSFLLTELKESIRKVVPSAIWLCQTKPDLIAGVFHHDPFLSLGAEEAAEIIKLVLLQYSHYFKATIGMGRTVHGMEELHLSYEHAASVLQHRGLHSEVEICSDNSAVDRGQVECFLSIQDVKHILNQYQTKEYDKLLHSALQLIEAGISKYATASQIKYLCTDILNTWIRAVESKHNDLNVPYYSGMFERLNRCMTWEELKSCFQHIHAQLFRTDETDDRTNKFADILTYIHDHYDKELSIDYFAGVMNMSTGHFSRTFKEEVGEKYVEYIAKYRLMKAKEYLLQTDMTIDNIAEKVGYWGRNSFIRTFRKYEGITPAKYRTIHQ